jgi:predicted GNAT family acetyltransferase
MATEVTDVPERERFEITVDGELAGFTQYARRPGLIAYVHTEIDPAFGGRGLGSELIAAAVAAARSEELEVLPFCQFVRGWFEKHPEELDLVPADRRKQFGLPADA